MTSAAEPARGTYSPHAARIVGWSSFLVFLLATELVIRIGWISQFIVPPPTEIAASFGRLVLEEHIIRRFFYTVGECLAAGVMITICGIGIGVLMYRYNLLRQACETWVAALASAPFVLAYPLFMVIFGRNAWAIIVMGFVSGLPPVILKTIEGISGTRRVLVNVGRSFNLTGAQQVWKILFPAAMPTIFVGIRLGLVFALINIVGTEFLINFGGLGQLITDLAERYDLAGTYAAICFVILVSIMFFMVLEKIERWLRPVD
ncbi:MAG TPA: ABC transporter permease subunit [Pseudolabrys sp.]